DIDLLHGVRLVNNAGNFCQHWIGQFVLPKHGMERAMTFMVGEAEARNIERLGTCRNRSIAGYENKFGFRIDKAAYEPRTSHAINANVFPGDPFHGRFSPLASSAFRTFSPS